jgi:hypothetical protein
MPVRPIDNMSQMSLLARMQTPGGVRETQKERVLKSIIEGGFKGKTREEISQDGIAINKVCPRVDELKKEGRVQELDGTLGKPFMTRQTREGRAACILIAADFYKFMDKGTA